MPEASIERQLGALTEAVQTLKKNDDKMFDLITGLHTKIDEKVERDADTRAVMMRDMGKMSGSVSIIMSVAFLFLKEGAARLFTK